MELKEAAVVAIVVAHNSVRSLPQCLQALGGQVPVVVVDNASSDGSVEAARKGGAFVILNTTNEGYGRANNQGVRAAERAEWCLIINPDALVDRQCLATLLKASERNPGAC
jgi:GT2 family glycosyltransferase